MQSKTAATHKLEQLIVHGRTKASEVVDYVMNHQPSDRLARGGELGFEPDSDTNAVLIEYSDSQGGRIRQRLHRHSVQQMAQTTDLPLKFIDGLQQTAEPWARELLAHNLKTVFTNRFTKSRYLLRSVSGEVRGFLSDHYRRLDSRPITGVIWETVLSLLPDELAKALESSIQETKPNNDAIKAAVAQNEVVPGAEVSRGTHLRVA
jgi:hypothetical protein